MGAGIMAVLARFSRSSMLETMREDYVPVSEPRFEGYYGKVSVLYDGLRRLQQDLPKRAAAGENIDALAEETWALFCSIR